MWLWVILVVWPSSAKTYILQFVQVQGDIFKACMLLENILNFNLIILHLENWENSHIWKHLTRKIFVLKDYRQFNLKSKLCEAIVATSSQ